MNPVKKYEMTDRKLIATAAKTACRAPPKRQLLNTTYSSAVYISTRCTTK